jgi:CRP-like cAMP-binding protein
LDLDALGKLEIFDEFSNRQLETIQGLCEDVQFKKGDCLFSQNAPADVLLILVEGQVDLRWDAPEDRRGANIPEVSFVSETSLFGWSCFVPPFHYALSGYCESRFCRAIRLEKRKLTELFAKDAELGYRFMSGVLRVIGKHFDQLQDALAGRRGHHIMSGW